MQQRRAKIILGSSITADEKPPRRRSRIYLSVETHLAHTKQLLNHQRVDATHQRDVTASGRDHCRQRAEILGHQKETTSRLSEAGAPKTKHVKYTRSPSIDMSTCISQTTPRSSAAGDETQTTDRLERRNGVANQA